MSADCIFCKISRGEIPATFVHQDDEIIAFRDINPVAPTHVLIVPRQHLVNTTEIDDKTAPLVGRMTHLAARIARDEKIDVDGYRLIMNTGPNGGQVVMHIHMHLLGGRQLKALG
jgi:histidine triad (HIT) family protein